MKPSKISKQQRMFETLEQRNLLAGNVTSSVSGDQLVLRGDGSANVITITQSGGVLKVAGAGTKVDGHTSETFTGITNLFIDMGGGSDVLTIKGVTLTGDTGEIGLGIILNTGNDALVMSGVKVTYETAIDGGSGNNAMAIDSCNFYCGLGISTGDNTDAITITRTNINGALQIEMGNGTNVLTMVTVTVSEIPAGGGSYPYETLPEGFDGLEDIVPENDCGAIIDGGSGVDAIAMNGVKIDCLTEINTFGGVDSVAIVNSRFGTVPNTLFDLSPNVDGGSEFSGLCIETGAGNDVVSVVTTNVYGFLQIDTSGQIDCPCDDSVRPAQDDSGSKDGNDAVALTKVNVYEAAIMMECTTDSTNDVVADEIISGWCCECVADECGKLLIYTGNQNDAVALAFVNTDCEAKICTTDSEDTSLDGNDAVAISNSNFNRNDEAVEWLTTNLNYSSSALSIHTGRGNDAVSIVKVNVNGKTNIDTGDGTDVVAIAFLDTDQLCVEVGPGSHDVLTVSNTTANDEVFADDGGSGGVLNYKHLNNHFANAPLITVAGWSIIV